MKILISGIIIAVLLSSMITARFYLGEPSEMDEEEEIKRLEKIIQSKKED
jgi:hypothetical protein